MSRVKATRLSSLVLIAGLLALVLTFADIHKIREALTGIRWEWALWVPILNVANTFIEALRFSVILFPIKKRLPILNSFNSNLIAIIGNVILPLRFGDGARAYYIARTEKIALSSSLSVLMLDRIADFLVFFSFVALTAVLHPFPSTMTKMGIIAGVVFTAAIAVIFLLAGIGHKIGENSSGRIRSRIADEVHKFMTGLSVMRNAGLIFPILLLSVFSWILRAAMIFVMFKAFGLDLPLIATPITLIFLNFGIAILSTPANLGGFELATVGALALFSVGIEVAVSYALALHVIEVVPMVAFGGFFLWFEGLKAKDVLESAKEMPIQRDFERPVPSNARKSNRNWPPDIQ